MTKKNATASHAAINAASGLLPTDSAPHIPTANSEIGVMRSRMYSR